MAVREHGGTQRWADEFGLPRSSRLDGPRRYWTEDKIETAVRELAVGGKR